MCTIHIANKEDIDFLDKLEAESFEPWVRNSRRSIANSISSPYQEVIIARNSENKPIGAAVLHLHKNTLRLYSIAVLKPWRKTQAGKQLMNFVKEYAESKDLTRITLEVDENKTSLISWYETFGFKKDKTLLNYYQEGIHALKMIQPLQIEQETTKQNLIVMDNDFLKLPNMENVQVVLAKDYISNMKYQDLKNARVFNLCSSYKYQSMGYYVSLLASARDHFILPTASAMSDYKNFALLKSISTELDDMIQLVCKLVDVKKFSINIFWGKTENQKFKQLATRLFMLLEIPIMQISFIKNEKWHLYRVSVLSSKSLMDSERNFLISCMHEYFSRKRFTQIRMRSYLYDLAILVNPDEKHPPSCRDALEQFKKAAEKMNVYVEFITKRDSNRLSEFDALLIRETTSVSNHTYQISRLAHAEGLIVIDDPWSILRCSNKIFLFERMKLNGINIPQSRVLSKLTFNLNDVQGMNFPLILKQPDGAFSVGVSKVNSLQELEESVYQMFKTSDLVIVQQFLPSDFDWRIGVLDNKPLYACKYFMARGHWQIYNWNETDTNSFGKHETIPVEEVPEVVLQTAVKAASLMGDGLYGVDLKELDGEVFVIEVNDNPNIDEGVEDSYLGIELYSRIIRSIVNRIELAKDYSKYAVEME